MDKAITAAKFISKHVSDNHEEYLNDLNLRETFSGIYDLNFPREDENRLIAFIIFAYDPDSEKLDIQKDRYENKYQIMRSLGLSVEHELIEEILTNSNGKFNDVVAEFLHMLTDWRWQTIFSLLDYHSNMIRFANQKTEDERTFDKMNKEGQVHTLTQEYNVDLIAKVNIQKADIFDRAIAAREKAEKLLDEIRKKYMLTDHAVQSDFNFSFTETAKKKVNIESWREYVRMRNER